MKRSCSVAVVFAAACLFMAGGGCSSAPVVGAPMLDAGYSTSSSSTHDPCTGEGFRQPTVASVVCPGAPTCACGGNDVCCLQAVDSSKGTCGPAGGCRYLVLSCDGPEDCTPKQTQDLTVDGGAEASTPAPDASPGADAGTSAPPPDAGTPPIKVCCLDEAVGLGGGGSSCRAVSQCTGKVLCRSDDDCNAVPGLPHCRPADYGTPGVEDKGLDGLVGYCQR